MCSKQTSMCILCVAKKLMQSDLLQVLQQDASWNDPSSDSPLLQQFKSKYLPFSSKQEAQLCLTILQSDCSAMEPPRNIHALVYNMMQSQQCNSYTFFAQLLHEAIFLIQSKQKNFDEYINLCYMLQPIPSEQREALEKDFYCMLQTFEQVDQVLHMASMLDLSLDNILQVIPLSRLQDAKNAEYFYKFVILHVSPMGEVMLRSSLLFAMQQATTDLAWINAAHYATEFVYELVMRVAVPNEYIKYVVYFKL